MVCRDTTCRVPTIAIAESQNKIRAGQLVAAGNFWGASVGTSHVMSVPIIVDMVCRDTTCRVLTIAIAEMQNKIRARQLGATGNKM